MSTNPQSPSPGSRSGAAAEGPIEVTPPPVSEGRQSPGLDACPFCGGKPDYNADRAWIHCPTCGAQGPFPTAKPAEDWNRRAPAPPRTPALEAAPADGLRMICRSYMYVQAGPLRDAANWIARVLAAKDFPQETEAWNRAHSPEDTPAEGAALYTRKECQECKDSLQSDCIGALPCPHCSGGFIYTEVAAPGTPIEAAPECTHAEPSGLDKPFDVRHTFVRDPVSNHIFSPKCELCGLTIGDIIRAKTPARPAIEKAAREYVEAERKRTAFRNGHSTLRELNEADSAGDAAWANLCAAVDWSGLPLSPAKSGEGGAG